MTVLSPDQWYTVLCHMNMVLIELYPKLQEVARDQIIVFFREGIKMNIPKVRGNPSFIFSKNTCKSKSHTCGLGYHFCRFACQEGCGI